MKDSIPVKVHALRTGKIKLTQSSASEILRSVGVRSSDIKVAERANRNLDIGLPDPERLQSGVIPRARKELKPSKNSSSQ